MRQKESELFLFMAFGFLFLGGDVYLGHVTSGLHHAGMWLPLVFVPVAVCVCSVRMASSSAVVKKVFLCTCWLAVIVGFLGFCFHFLKFLRDLTGHVAWDVVVRLLRYPPLLAPLAVSGLGVLGLLIRRMGTK